MAVFNQLRVGFYGKTADGSLRVSAVERRARTLTAEYLKKARELDRVYGNVPEGEVGRVERKLTGYGQVRGFVFGAFGEASGGVHELVQRLGETKVKAVGVQQGRETVKGEMGVIVGQVRRLLSVTAVRAQGERSWWRNRGSKEEEATCWVSGGEMGKGEGGSGGGEEARKACGQERTLPP